MKLLLVSAILAIIVVASKCTSFLQSARGGEPLHVVRLTTELPSLLTRMLKNKGYDVISDGKNSVDVITSDNSLLQLSAFHKKLQPYTTNFEVLDSRVRSNHAMGNNQLSSLLSNITKPGFLVQNVPSGYRNFAKVIEFIKNLESSNNDVVKVLDLLSEYKTGQTVDNHPIFAIKISENATQNLDKDNVLIASCHHSRETITPEIAMVLAEDIIKRYRAKDPSIVNLLKTTQIIIIPVVNVDGFVYTYEKNNWWRKNRRLVDKEEYGVDLNRNYDLGWKDCGGSEHPGSEVYRGPSELSEVESQTIVALSKDYSFSKVLDFHSSGREVLTAYTCTKMPEIMRKYIVSRGIELMKYADYQHRVPSDDGEHQEHQIKHHTSYSFLVETGTQFQPPYSECLSEVKRVLPLIYHFLNVSIPLKGHVKNEQGAPVEAQIKVKEIEWLAGETRKSNSRFGSYHLFLPAGQTFTITFSAEGYVSQEVSVTLSNDEQYGTQTKEIILKKN